MFRVTSPLALNCATLKCVLQPERDSPVAKGVSDLSSRGSAQYLTFHSPLSILHYILKDTDVSRSSGNSWIFVQASQPLVCCFKVIKIFLTIT